MKYVIAMSVFVFVGAFGTKFIENVRQVDEDIKMETHQVITSDLYILRLFRLRNLKKTGTNRYSVLMFHGLMESSDRFIEHGRNLSLAYDLVDTGFDVWLGNNRGNKYSREHLYLNPDDPVDKFKFFNYTYEDIGVYDVAAVVDYILEETKTKQLHYIGHSQGGTIFSVLNSLQPEYNGKFLTANLLAGAGYQKHFTDLTLEILSLLADKIYALLLELGFVEMFPFYSGVKLSSSNKVEDLVDHCLNSIRFINLCQMLHQSELLGVHKGTIWFSGGGAVKEFVIFGQNVRQKRFCRWDYGKANQEVYGTTDPPSYNLGLVTVNTTLHFGMGDALVNYKDVEDMAYDMPNVRTRKVARSDFGHSDFVDAVDAKELVYDYIIESLLQFEGVIKPDMNREKSPVYLTIINASNLINNDSNLLASVKSDSPITWITSFTTSAPNLSNTEINTSRTTTRKFSDFTNVNFPNSLPRNASSNTNILKSLSTNTLKTLQANERHSLSTESADADVMYSLTTNISNSSNASEIIIPNYLVKKYSDILEKHSPEWTNKNATHSYLRYNSAPATSTKGYINKNLLITVILTSQIV